MSEHAPFGGVANPHAPFEPANLPAGSIGTAAILNAAVTEEKLAPAVVAKLNPSAWNALALGAKLEQFAGGFQESAVRSEDGATMARLRGILKVKAAEELKPGETVATIPAGFRPPASVAIGGEANGVFTQVTITNAGVITVSVAVVATASVILDGLTYNLT